MTKKQIKKLAVLSYTNNNLDRKKINKITKTLRRSELREYIRTIKLIENNKQVALIIPKISGEKTLIKEVKRIFPGKKVLIKEDKSLIAGIKIIDRDNIYDFNFKNTLENLVNYINQ